ncbi:hypothetical protein FOZ61_008633 [Perkinsus olseni]|uniref:J domain-containing protein n=1 Tax=Perkinsus olseni TaxID=32597 RepID=A0A7J6L2Q8_PEROL|nr:hypothetical protein FOZ61_008633 [Perkinsus olseni]
MSSSPPAEFKDFYEVLGICPTATDAEIKTAYRETIKLWHPDKHKGDGREEALGKSQMINEAYAVLRDPDKRQKFDIELLKNRRARADAAKEEGNKCYRSSKFEEAVQHYSLAIELDSTNHVYYSNRSTAHAALAEWGESREDAEKCLEMNEQSVRAHYNLVRAKIKMGHLGDAQKTLTIALGKFPRDSDLVKLRTELFTSSSRPSTPPSKLVDREKGDGSQEEQAACFGMPIASAGAAGEGGVGELLPLAARLRQQMKPAINPITGAPVAVSPVAEGSLSYRRSGSNDQKGAWQPPPPMPDGRKLAAVAPPSLAVHRSSPPHHVGAVRRDLTPPARPYRHSDFADQPRSLTPPPYVEAGWMREIVPRGSAPSGPSLALAALKGRIFNGFTSKK